MAAVVQVHQDISKACNRLKRHTDSWKKYSDIWKADRVSLLDKFKAKAPPTPAFEEKFAKFQKVGPVVCAWLCGAGVQLPFCGASAACAKVLRPAKPLCLLCFCFVQQAAFFWEQAHDTDIGCVRISNASLALAVHEECCAWTRALAAAMRELDAAALAALREGIAAKHEVLQCQPEDLEQLKAVLHVINTIRWAGPACRLS